MDCYIKILNYFNLKKKKIKLIFIVFVLSWYCIDVLYWSKFIVYSIVFFFVVNFFWLKNKFCERENLGFFKMFKKFIKLLEIEILD